MLVRALAILFLIPMMGVAQGVDQDELTKSPDWISLPEALKEASASDDKIMVFIYTDWCSYCQRMLANTFQDDSVLDYLGEYFQTVRVNAESSDEVDLDGQVVTEAQLAMALGARGFPYMVFMEPTGEYITHLPGYLEASDYLCVLSYIGTESYESLSYTEHLETCTG
jgi:thioredoxin-related protein